METGSKVIGFRLPVDLAAEFEQYCAGAELSSAEVLRKLVDDLIYPGSGRERLYARRETATMADFERLYGVEATEKIAELVNAQIKEQLKEQLGDLVDEHLELVQIDRGLTEAEKRHYDSSLATLESNLAEIKTGVNKLVQTVNNNVEMVNSNLKAWGDKVSLLFLYLEAHTHWMPKDADKLATGKLIGPKATEFNKEVELAKKRVGDLDGTSVKGS